jgi:hypothetical protein
MPAFGGGDSGPLGWRRNARGEAAAKAEPDGGVDTGFGVQAGAVLELRNRRF